MTHPEISAPPRRVAHGHVIVRLPSEIDFLNAPAVSDSLLAVLNYGAAGVIADMTCTRFCDAAGCRVDHTGQPQGPAAQGVGASGHRRPVRPQGIPAYRCRSGRLGLRHPRRGPTVRRGLSPAAPCAVFSRAARHAARAAGQAAPGTREKTRSDLFPPLGVEVSHGTGRPDGSSPPAARRKRTGRPALRAGTSAVTGRPGDRPAGASDPIPPRPALEELPTRTYSSAAGSMRAGARSGPRSVTCWCGVHAAGAGVRPAVRDSPDSAEDLMQVGYVGLLKAIGNYESCVREQSSDVRGAVRYRRAQAAFPGQAVAGQGDPPGPGAAARNAWRRRGPHP